MTPLLAALVGDWAIRVPVAVLIDTVLELEVVWLWATLIFDHMARAAWLGVSFLRGHRSETRSGLDRSPTTQRL